MSKLKSCRTCLTNPGKHSIFYGVNDGVPIKEQLSSVTNLQMQAGDGLPPAICSECLHTLHIASNFKKQCEVSHSILQKEALLMKKKKLAMLQQNQQKPIFLLLYTPISKPASKVVGAIRSIECPPLLHYGGVDPSVPKPIKEELLEDSGLDLTDVDIIQDPEIEIKEEAEDLENPEFTDAMTFSTDMTYETQIDIKEEPLIWLKQGMEVDENDVITFEQNEMQSTSMSSEGFDPPDYKDTKPIISRPKGRDYSIKVECEICNKLISKPNYNLHLKYHMVDKPFRCEYCDKAFIQNGHYKAHLVSHTGVKLFKCPHCIKVFGLQSTLNRHLLSHNIEKAHTCPVCNKMFKLAKTLKQHRLTHTDVKPHKCIYCPKAFTQSGTLSAHVKEHTGLRLYTCPTCQKGFKTSFDLKRHCAIHSGLRPYQCMQCNKTFALMSHLKTHALTHNGVRTHMCPECGRAFLRAGDLKRHRKLHVKDIEKGLPGWLMY